MDDDQRELGDEVPATKDRSKYIMSTGRTLPVIVLKNALGGRFNKFVGARGICVVLRVKNPEWIGPILAAAKLITSWDGDFDATGNPRQKGDRANEVMTKLAKGGRVLCMTSEGHPLPPRLLSTADIMVDIDRLTRTDVAQAIKQLTGGRAHGLREQEVANLDLIDAVAAIRAHTSPGSCLRRIRASKATRTIDPMIARAPLLSELRGYGEAGEWGERLIQDLGRWRAGELEFSAIQRNIVLSGAAGTGKTSFVRSLARSAELPLIASSMGTLFSNTAGHLGSVIQGIDALFAEARAAGPSAIVLLDELEGFPDRATLDPRNADWWTPVVNHVLTVLDGATSAASNLVVIGATNFPEKLDAALVRPGRLDRIVHIQRPNEEDLAYILRQHLGADLPDAELEAIAPLALGRTGAEAEGFVKTARALARSDGRALMASDLVDAICPPSRLPPEMIYRTAIHEAGHAVASIYLGNSIVKSIAITGSDSSGHVIFQRSGPHISGEEQHVQEVVRLLAGRAAEEALLGTPSSGAGGEEGSDLHLATSIVAALRLSWGLGGALAFSAGAEDALQFARLSASTMQLVDQRLQQIYQDALNLIRLHELEIRTVADALVTERVMSGDRFARIVEDVRAERPAAPNA